MEDRKAMDIGRAFAVTGEDPEWTSKLLTVGACILIPLAGILQLRGYGYRAYMHQKGGGTGLPTPQLGEDIVVGFKKVMTLAFLNILPVMLVFGLCWGGCTFGPMAIAVGGAAASGSEGNSAAPGLIMMAGMVGGYGILLLGVLLLSVVALDLERRVYNGELTPIFSIGRTLRAIAANPVAYLMLWLGALLAGLVGSAGAILCYVGMFATLPFGLAVRGRLLAQWDAIASASDPEADAALDLA